MGKRKCRGGVKKRKARILGGGIFNLREAVFKEEELKVLDLGLKYAPDKDLDKFDAYIDLQRFVRKINIKKFFASKEQNSNVKETTNFKHSNLRNHSIFNPKMQHNESLLVFKKNSRRGHKEIKGKKVKK